jgi:hypothetical protein
MSINLQDPEIQELQRRGELCPKCGGYQRDAAGDCVDCFADWPLPAPEDQFCSSCRDHTVFERDLETDDPEWLSVCCAARAISVDVESADR